MRKLAIISALVIMSSQVYAQKDSTKTLHADSTKRDTTYVPVPLFEYSDTSKATALYLAPKGVVKYAPVLVIRKGFVAKDAKGNPQWVEQPAVQGILTEDKQPFKEKVINLF